MQETPGEYDLYALSHLYGGSVKESKTYFGKRQKLTDFYDPRSMSFDLGDDAAASVPPAFEILLFLGIVAIVIINYLA